MDYILYVVLFICMAYLFYNWKSVPLNPFHLFCPVAMTKIVFLIKRGECLKKYNLRTHK